MATINDLTYNELYENYMKVLNDNERLKEQIRILQTELDLVVIGVSKIDEPKPITPMENRKNQHNFQGEWRDSIDNNFDIFS